MLIQKSERAAAVAAYLEWAQNPRADLGQIKAELTRLTEQSGVVVEASPAGDPR